MENVCKHEWVYFKSAMLYNDVGYRQTEYVMIDCFHCKYCLEQKEIEKKETVGQGEPIPSWYHKQ